MNNVNKNTELSSEFDWEIYLQCNPALKDLNTYEAAYEHWVKVGQARSLVATEEQFYVVYGFDRSNLPDDFDWQTYLKLNSDVAARMNSKWQAIRHFLKYGSQENRHYSYITLINSLIKENLEQKACHFLQDAVKANPLSFELHCLSGHIFEKLENYSDAAASYSNALKLQPDQINICRKLGEILLKLDRIEESESLLDRVIKHYPNSSEAQCILGDIAVKKQQWDKALALYLHALEDKAVAIEVKRKITPLLRKVSDFLAVAQQILFDADFYYEQLNLSQLPLPTSKSEAVLLEHYLEIGAAYRISCHPLIDEQYCYEQFKVKNCNSEDEPFAALKHILLEEDLDFRPHILFDPKYYADHAFLDHVTVGEALIHFLFNDKCNIADPHILFSVNYFSSQYQCQINPLVDYIYHENAWSISPHPLFDATFYAAQLAPEERRQNLLMHFLRTGSSKDLDPHPYFSCKFYKLQKFSCYIDKNNPLEDYLKYYNANPSQDFLNSVFLYQNPDAITTNQAPLLQYALKSRSSQETFNWSDLIQPFLPTELKEHVLVQMTREKNRNPYFAQIPNAFRKASWDYRFSTDIDKMLKYAQQSKRRPVTFLFHQFDPFYHPKDAKNIEVAKQSAKELLNQLRQMKEAGSHLIHVWHNPLPHNRNFLDADYYLYSGLNEVLDLVISHCHIAKDWIRQFCPTVPISILPHPSLLPHFNTFIDKSVARKELGFDQESFLITSVGEMKPYKNIPLLLESWIAYQSKCPPNTYLVLAGKMLPETSYFIKEQSRKIQNVAIIDDYLSDHQISLYLAASDACVFTHKEIWVSGAVMTAMTFGKPVIIPNQTGLVDYVLNEDNGILFQNGDYTSLIQAFATIQTTPLRPHIEYMNQAWAKDHTAFALQSQYAQAVAKVIL